MYRRAADVSCATQRLHVVTMCGIPGAQSFTSIVGPNGSGKSNVIDSMLFVFGYRAQKIR